MDKKLNFLPLQNTVSLRSALHALSTYKLAWKVGFYTLLLVALIPIVILFGLVLAGNLHFGGVAVLLTLAVGGAFGLIDMYRSIKENARIQAFASTNGLLMVQDSLGADYPGARFAAHDVLIASAIRTPDVSFLEIGNYKVIGAQERTNNSPTFGYMRIKLSRRLPNMYLYSNQNPLKLQYDFSSLQKLELEGDFNDYFTLYVPNGYGKDAFYIFSPDMMVRFIDHLGAFDCEIIDDELYLYSSRKFDLTSSQELTSLMSLSEQVSAKFTKQTQYYSDEFVGEKTQNTIAPTGQRLEKKIKPWGVILGAAIATGIFAFLCLLFVSALKDGNSLRIKQYGFVLAMITISALVGIARPFFNRPKQ